MALPRAAPPNWPDVEAPPIVRLGKCQGETKRDARRTADTREGVNSGETHSNRVKIRQKKNKQLKMECMKYIALHNKYMRS